LAVDFLDIADVGAFIEVVCRDMLVLDVFTDCCDACRLGALGRLAVLTWSMMVMVCDDSIQ
jgi:hypothetical protein